MSSIGDITGPRSKSLSSIDSAMQELRCFPRGHWLDLARSDQSHRWRRGSGVAAEDYFRQLPEVRADLEEALVLINGEIQLRRELGQAPIVDEYRDRFPELAERIAVQFKVDRMLESSELANAIDVEEDISGLELPGYEFLEELGRGAAGVVYRARQESLDRFVAIKVFAIPGADAKQLARQRQEAEILARLHHPNVVHIYEVRDHRGCLHLVMEYIDGATLTDRTRGRLLGAEESARLTATLAEAVHAVHEAGILHRDLKPSNVLLTSSGELKITDFGLAKLQSNGNQLTTTDSILGTPCYMAPEQAVGEAHSIGPEADVYSLGAMLYELLTGRPPLLGATVLDTLSLIRFQEPVAPRHLQPRLPRDLETICLKCLAKLPTQRYATAAALAADLRRFLAGAPIVARPPGVLERVGRLIKRKPAAAGLVTSLMLLAGVVVAALWFSFDQRHRLSAAALVESIATADSQALPQLLNELQMQRSRALPLIRAELASSTSEESAWVNLAIAELAADPAARTDELLNYLPHARPQEVPAIVQVLAPRADTLRSEVWRMLLEEPTTDGSQLNLACLAAKTDALDSRWPSIAPAVARALVRQHPLDVGTFTLALWPAREALVSSLVTQFRDPRLEPITRDVAAGILARFAAEQPATLVDTIVEAEASEFRLILPALQKHVAAALPRLESIANQPVNFEQLAADPTWQTKRDVERAYDAAERRRACAIIAMWQLGDVETLLAALRYDAAPALRAWVIELSAPLGVSTDELRTHAMSAADSGVRQALLLALGQRDLTRLMSAEREQVVTGLLEIYRNDPDAGVHSACSWLLRTRLNASEDVDAVDKTLAGEVDPARRWLVGPNGHTLAIFRGPQTFLMGSPATEMLREADEAAHEQRIGHSFGISTEEVTIAQFERFRNRYVNRRYSPTDDCPSNNVTWFEAAAYCRWLSEQAGLPGDQMCYPAEAKIGPGMTLPENWLERTGYRLPTEAEWEFACRGGAEASCYFGEGDRLRTHYAWFLQNSDNHAWPVGQLKPNHFGLFDMLGNVAERCQDAMATYPTSSVTVVSDTPTEPQSSIGASDMRAFRGGNFGDIDSNIRSARRSANTVQDAWALIGFRPARTLSP